MDSPLTIKVECDESAKVERAILSAEKISNVTGANVSFEYKGITCIMYYPGNYTNLFISYNKALKSKKNLATSRR